MCCSGDHTAKNLEQAQYQMTLTLNNDYKIAFGEQQAVLARLNNQFSYIMNNPQGYDMKTLASMRTSATDENAVQFSRAMAAGAAFSATHGAADVSSGTAAQIGSEIAASGAAMQAQSQNQITQAQGQAKRQDYWNALQGLSNVGSMYNPTSYAGAGATAANSSVNAGQLLLQSQQATWSNMFGVIKGAAGLAMGGAGALSAGISAVAPNADTSFLDAVAGANGSIPS
jgi:hypothetical protein